MIAFPANADIVVVHTPVSFACGIDGMSRCCRILLAREPMDRAYFLFVNRRLQQVRVLWYDGQGMCLFCKRLSMGKLRYWPKAGESVSSIVAFFEAQVLIGGGDPRFTEGAQIWKKI